MATGIHLQLQGPYHWFHNVEPMIWAFNTKIIILNNINSKVNGMINVKQHDKNISADHCLVAEPDKALVLSCAIVC